MVIVENIWTETDFIHMFHTKILKGEQATFTDDVKTTQEFKNCVANGYCKIIKPKKEKDTNDKKV